MFLCFYCDKMLLTDFFGAAIEVNTESSVTTNFDRIFQSNKNYYNTFRKYMKPIDIEEDSSHMKQV